MLALSGPKTTILVIIQQHLINESMIISFCTTVSYILFLQIGYEIRSTNVHDQMTELWKKHFEVKIVPKSKVYMNLQLQTCLNVRCDQDLRFILLF